MKYIVFWEFCPSEIDKVVEKFRKVMGEREKFPDKYPKHLFPSHSMAGETKGFQVVEATSDQITNAVLAWRPLMKLKYVPIFDVAKVTEQYLKSK